MHLTTNRVTFRLLTLRISGIVKCNFTVLNHNLESIKAFKIKGTRPKLVKTYEISTLRGKTADPRDRSRIRDDNKKHNK